MYETVNAALIAKAKEMLVAGTVNRVLGWQKGLFNYDITPAVFVSAEEIDTGFIYNEFCGANLSKYLIKESRKDGKILVFLKPCDTYSFNQLLKEHRILRENVYVVGIPCTGMKQSETGETAERCLVCRGTKHMAYDEQVDGCDDSDLIRLWLKSGLQKLRNWKRCLLMNGMISGGKSCPGASDAMHAGMYVLPVPVNSACLTIRIQALHRKLLRIHLKKICSILSGRSMLPDGVLIAGNVPVCVPSTFRFIC